MLALIIPVLFLYAWLRRRLGDRGTDRTSIVVAGGGCIIGVVPLAAQLASLWSRRGSSPCRTSRRSVTSCARSCRWPSPWGSAIGALVARTQGPVAHRAGVRARPGAAALAGTWLAVAPATLFLLSVVTGVMLFAPEVLRAGRTGGGCALRVVRRVDSDPHRRAGSIAACFAIVAILVSGGALKNGEDWRGAVAFTGAAADADTLVLIHPAFVESAQLDWLEDPRATQLPAVAASPSTRWTRR